ncbi:MAG: gluconate 2-dehydrogenase subunit 3 family protein [Chryseosolibacter sp.]
MDRRDTIKRLMTASGALIALPAWADGWSAGDVMLHNTSFHVDARETLAAVTDTIIPAGDSIGALTAGVDKFLQRLLDDCYEKDVQDNVKTQLSALDASAQSLHGKTFKDCDQPQREQILLARAASGNEAEEAFFALIKAETIRGFNTSREVMVNYLHFRQVPGHYHGCVDVNA